MANLKIELVKSVNGRLKKHIATANSMGLRRIGDISALDAGTLSLNIVALSTL